MNESIRRRKREKEQRRKTILKAARKQFFEKGFNAVTVASIAKKAELSKGAIYLYFESKEEIYAGILLADIQKLYKKVSPIFEEGKSAEEMLLKFVDIYIDFFLHERELFRILMMFVLRVNNVSFSDVMNRQIMEVIHNTIEIIEKILQSGVSTGEFLPKEDLRKSREALWGMLNGLIVLHLFSGKRTTREERIRSHSREGIRIFVKGLKNPLQPAGECSGVMAML